MTKAEWVDGKVQRGQPPLLVQAIANYVEAVASVNGQLVVDWTGLTVLVHIHGGITIPTHGVN